MELALGCAQFGMDYGISNSQGMVKDTELENILVTAQQQGVKCLDLAEAYGECIARLGQFTDLIQPFELTNKYQSKDLNQDFDSLIRQVESSLKILNKNCFERILIHDGDCLESNPQVWKHLKRLKSQGLAKKIGVSLYSPQQVDALSEQFEFDTVQVPYNLLDQRLLDTSFYQASNPNLEICVRSIFLQGLLLSEKVQNMNCFTPWRAVFKKLQQLGLDFHLNALELSLAAIKGKAIQQLIIGCTQAQELIEILEALNRPMPNQPAIEVLSCADEALILPMNWPKVG